jgi:hypothetical protein
MGDEAPVRRVRPTERTAGEPTPGMTREQAVTTDTMWAGFVRTDAGMVSRWQPSWGVSDEHLRYFRGLANGVRARWRRSC